MSLRWRIIVAAAAAVAAAVVLVIPGAYFVTRHELRHQVDVSLVRRLTNADRLRSPRLVGPGALGSESPRRIAGEAATFEVISGAGAILFGNGTPIPVAASDRAAAAAPGRVRLRDATVGGTHLRVAARGIGNGIAVIAAAPLDAVDGTLHRLVVLLALLALAGIALAAGSGMMVARAALAPVERLTAAAERVAATRDLTATIPVHGADEVARLAHTLNAMLVALDESQRAQRRLVADASHELRTPLTSLRTNLEVLARSPMPEGERHALLADVIDQVSELGTLVGQLVDLDRLDGAPPEPQARLAFDEVVASAVQRARRNNPGLAIEASLAPTSVMGWVGLLERAVANLLDNAAKWSAPGGSVEVTLVEGVLRVRDHGPGIDAQDLPYVFERFYRSVGARGLPGSGLGLSIVKQAAQDHGGRAWVEPAPGGGTLACLQVPVASAEHG